MSLAALNRASRATHDSPDAVKHYKKAITKHNESLCEPFHRESAATSKDSHLILILCLLTFCFYAWNGCQNSAILEALSALLNVRRWLDKSTFRPDSIDDKLIQLLNRLENSTVVSLGTKIEDRSAFFRSR